MTDKRGMQLISSYLKPIRINFVALPLNNFDWVSWYLCHKLLNHHTPNSSHTIQQRQKTFPKTFFCSKEILYAPTTLEYISVRLVLLCVPIPPFVRGALPVPRKQMNNNNNNTNNKKEPFRKYISMEVHRKTAQNVDGIISIKQSQSKQYLLESFTIHNESG